MNRRKALKLLGGAVAAAPLAKIGFPQVGRAALSAPNILFVMTDDQRWDTMSISGNRFLKTPNMDRVGREGMFFREAFVTNSLCAPSRASILTGQYSHVHGVTTNGAGPVFLNQPGLKDDQETFITLLRRSGYHTAVMGKWHLRSWPSGFDQWAVFPGQGTYFDPVMIANGTHLKMRGYVDDVVGDQALQYLDNRPKDKPFCLMYTFKSPHRAWEPAPRFAHVFDDVEIPLPRTFEDKYEGRSDALRRAQMAIADMPDFRERGVPADLPFDERKRRNYEQLVKNYYRVLLSVDENLGRVLDYLDKNKLAENTLVIYTSDNGFFLGEHGLFDKRLMYEPSIRVPMNVRFPGRVKPGQTDSTHMVLNVDIAPTILDFAGVPVPNTMQGRSWRAILEGGKPQWRDAFFYEYYEYPAEHCARKNRGVRTDRWKLIDYWEQPEQWELYDVKNDPDEINNLAGKREYAATMKELQEKMAQLRAELGDKDPPGPASQVAPCDHPELARRPSAE